MITKATVSPDTCQCYRVTFEVDDSVYPPTRKSAQVLSVEKLCKDHDKLSPEEYIQILEENWKKNLVFKEIIEKVDANLTPDNFKYSFDVNRNLTIDTSGVKPSLALQEIINDSGLSVK